MENNDNKYDKLVLGIDFGTTNSCLCVWYNSKAIIIPDIDGNDTISTVIEISNNKKIIGKEAYIRKEIFNDKTSFLIYEIKKILGKKYSELTQLLINSLAFNIISDDNDNVLILDDNTNITYHPEEIATHLFQSFKTKSEKYLSNKFNTQIVITDIVVSVPAYFTNTQRQIIKNIASFVGFNVLRVINEPTAAAICYGIGKKSQEQNIIVYDFGGGTLDVSVVNISDGVYEVLGSCGNNNLGGSDFDNNIIRYCIKEFIKEHDKESFLIYSENKKKELEKQNINRDLNQYTKELQQLETKETIIDEEYVDIFMQNISNNSLSKLKYISEQAKISLSDSSLNSIIKIDNFHDNKKLQVSLSREKFIEITQDLVRLAIKPVQDVIELCELDKSDIDEIIMVGGMTRVPTIRLNIERFFNKDVNCSINPDNVVSIGCAIHGHMIVNKEAFQDKILLIDRTSLSIGVELSGGISDIIIPRGTIIPVKKTKKYTTDRDFTEWINVKIFEGERKFTKDNFLIGDFILSGIEKEKRGIPEILITFSIDTDSIIKVYAEDLNNPLNKKSIMINDRKNNLTEEQINQIIENAKKMDAADREEIYKKESHFILLENSKRIIENLNNPELKIPDNEKYFIIDNITTIVEWLNATCYKDIENDKYKELLHDYDVNYSIYLLQTKSNIVELETIEEEKNIGIEIYDENTNAKLYERYIIEMRNVISNYDQINKQINIVKHLNNDETVMDVIKTLNDNTNFINDQLIDIFVNKDIDELELIKTVNTINNNYDEFMTLYLGIENINIINNLLDKIKIKEEELFLEMETNEEIDNSDKLDIIMEIDNEIYKMNGGYSQISLENIQKMINIIDSL